jgi:transcriptional regulator GlxA family with amidase domain
MISWPASATPLLDLWLSRAKQDDSRSRAIASRPFSPNLIGLVDRIESAVEKLDESSELMLLSCCYEAVTHLMMMPDLVQLSSTPPSLPPSIQDLVDAVRKNPSNSWPLRDAADRAGYSPFHFSRVFKSLVGFGFHEYVDRCRTELAVSMLATSDRPVESVAQASGFGTTQGLRESIKEYLGLVPSELRSGAMRREEA